MSLQIHWSVICNKQFHLIATSRNDIVSQRWYIYVLYVYIHISSFFSFSSVILVFARRFSFIFFQHSSRRFHQQNMKYAMVNVYRFVRKSTSVCFLLYSHFHVLLRISQIFEHFSYLYCHHFFFLHSTLFMPLVQWIDIIFTRNNSKNFIIESSCATHFPEIDEEMKKTKVSLLLIFCLMWLFRVLFTSLH